MTLTHTLSSLLSKLLSRRGDYRMRYGRAYGSNSVDYRRHKRALWRGEAPPRVIELSSHIPAGSVVDIGAAEGILAMELAAGRPNTRVRAIDVTPRRHVTGTELRTRWLDLGRPVEGCEMVLGDALTDPSLLDGFDTLVASRVIYYFGDRVDPFMAEVAQRVRQVCLVGNASRNKRLARGRQPADIGANVVYSTPEGMADLLTRHGFEIVASGLASGDPYVIGRRPAA